MRFGRDFWILVTITALFIIAGSFIARDASNKQQQIFPVRTSYSSGPSGVRAAYLLLRQLGYRTIRHRESFSKIPPGAKVIFIIDPIPTMVFSGRELASLDEWVSKGGTLICFNGYPRVFPALEDLDVKAIKYEESPYHPKSRTGYFSNIRKLHTGSAVRISEIANSLDYHSIMEDKRGIIAAVKIQGKGRKIAVADPSIISNSGIGRNDNAVFIANLTAFNARKGEIVVFDEYHQGYGEKRTIAKIIGKYGRIAALQLMVLFILAAYSAGRRFGAVRPAERPAGRVGYEYIEAMARIYKRAGAGMTAADILCRDFRKNIARRLGLPEDAGIDMLTNAAYAAWQADKNALGGLLLRCSKIAGGPKAADSEIVRLASDIRRFEKEAGIVRHH